jgi:hypothetical protein
MNLCNLLRMYAGKPPLDERRSALKDKETGEDREAFEERAAIMEHDGGLSRKEAEKEAMKQQQKGI